MFEGGIKRHVYDLELKSLLVNYSVEIKKEELVHSDKTPEYFINLVKFQVNEYCKDKGIQIDDEMQILVTPADGGAYKAFLGLSLIFYDLHKIRQYLNYQEKQFLKYSESNEQFVGVVEFLLVDHLKYSSPVNNLKRLAEVMKWVEDKLNTFKFEDIPQKSEENLFQGEKPTLDWEKTKLPFLLKLSEKLALCEHTEDPLDFRAVFISQTKIAWKGAASWVYLMFRLTTPPYNYITCKKGRKPYFTIAPEYFEFCDYRKKKSKKINFTSMLYNVKKVKSTNATKTRQDIDSMLLGVFGKPEIV